MCRNWNMGNSIISCNGHWSRRLLQSPHKKLDFAIQTLNAIPQCPDPRDCQSQTCDSNADLDDFCSTNSNFDSSSFSPSNSFVDRNREFPSDSSLPPNYYGDSSSSCFRIFQNFGTYPKNYFDINKDSSPSWYNSYEAKKPNMNTFDGDDLAPLNLDERDLYLTKLIDEVTKLFPTKVKHKDGYEDYNKNQTAKDETKNDIGILSNPFGPLKCEQYQFIRTHEVLQWKNRTLANHIFKSRERQESLKRYRAKRTKRKFGKQIRYKSRKSTADTKKRMKGRFTKAGAEYDYDPKADIISKEK